MKIIKKFDDLRSGDRLFCVNMDTHEKVLCEVIRKNRISGRLPY